MSNGANLIKLTNKKDKMVNYQPNFSFQLHEKQKMEHKLTLCVSQ